MGRRRREGCDLASLGLGRLGFRVFGLGSVLTGFWRLSVRVRSTGARRLQRAYGSTASLEKSSVTKHPACDAQEPNQGEH